MGVNEDELLSLIAGEPIYSSIVRMRPKTIKEILKEGHNFHRRNLFIVSRSVDEFIRDTKEAISDKEDDFITHLDSVRDELTRLGLHSILSLDDSYKRDFVNAFSYFTEIHRERIIFNGTSEVSGSEINIIIGSMEDHRELMEPPKKDENGAFVSEDGSPIKTFPIDSERFDNIINIVMIQNSTKSILSNNALSEPEIVPHDDKVRELLERMKKNQERVAQAKNGDGGKEGISFGEVVGIVTTKSNSINKMNVKELTIFQLYDELHRLTLYEKYDIIMKARLAGADIEDEDETHWADNLYICKKD